MIKSSFLLCGRDFETAGTQTLSLEIIEGIKTCTRGKPHIADDYLHHLNTQWHEVDLAEAKNIRSSEGLAESGHSTLTFQRFSTCDLTCSADPSLKDRVTAF